MKPIWLTPSPHSSLPEIIPKKFFESRTASESRQWAMYEQGRERDRQSRCIRVPPQKALSVAVTKIRNSKFPDSQFLVRSFPRSQFSPARVNFTACRPLPAQPHASDELFLSRSFVIASRLSIWLLPRSPPFSSRCRFRISIFGRSHGLGSSRCSSFCAAGLRQSTPCCWAGLQERSSSIPLATG